MSESSIVANPSSPVEDDDVSLLDMGVVIAESLRLLVFGPLVVGLAALGISFLITPTYTARTSFLLPQQQQSSATAMLSQLGALSGLAASATGIRNPSDQYVALLKSEFVADRLIDRFKLMEFYDAKFRQDVRKALEKKTRISSGVKDGLIVVEVDDESPKRAADMANAYVFDLKSLMGSLALTEAQQRRAFFERQLEQTKVNLTAAELALGGIGVSADAIKSDPKAAVEAVARLQAQVTAQEVRIASLRGYLTESAPEFKRAELALAALRTQLQKNEAGGSLATAGGYIEKYRDFKYQETLFELFARQFEIAKVDEAKEGALVQVVDVALPPERKSKPAKALIAIVATLTAGIFFLGWVFAQKAFENIKRHPQNAGKLTAIFAGFLRLLPMRRS